MRARNSAVERADAARERAAVPELPRQCSSCARWVGRERLCVAAIGAEDVCGLCAAVTAVENAIATCTITADQEEQAVSVLRDAYDLIRGR